MDNIKIPTRVPYYDIAKGILILTCILHHLPQVTRYILHIENGTLMTIDSYAFLYKAFFMGAFFFITGCCSSFNSSFLDMLKKSGKQLLLPALFLEAVSQTIFLISEGCTDVISYLKIIHIKEFLLYGCTYWFISALIIAKLMCWFLFNKVKKTKCVIAISLLLLVIGVGFSNSYDGQPYWYFYYAFIATFFVVMGKYYKMYSKRIEPYIGYFVPIYVLFLFLYSYLGGVVPSYALGFKTNYCQIIPFLILSVSGVYSVVFISKLISANKFLEFWGRNSIVAYCLQISLYALIQRLELPLLYFNAYLFYFIVFITFLILCYFFIRILNMPYIRFLMGKW